MFKDIIRKYGVWAVAAVSFLAAAMVYCYPELAGKVLHKSDVTMWDCGSRQLREYNNAHPEDPSLWNESMFAGMPSYQISVSSPKSALNNAADSLKSFVDRLLHLFTSGTVFFIVGYLVAFYFLFRALGAGGWLSIAGSLATSFSTYFIIILNAGHETKAITLAAMAAIMAGFILIFRKKYAWGASLVMLYSSIGMMRHPQMAYYIFMLIAVLAVAEVVTHIREKRIKDLLVAAAIFIASVGVGFGTGWDTYKSNKEYVGESTRGGHSDLTALEDGEKKNTGLSLEYATDFSYGIDETFNLLIPDFKGGASHYDLGEDSDIYKSAIKQGYTKESAKSMTVIPGYWGSQPFTEAPVYVGAIICFLFVLGLCIVKGPYKWALAIGTLLSFMLAWGNNFMWLTKLFYNVMPLYNKFRTVSSILVVAQFAMPMLGFLALREVLGRGGDSRKITRAIIISAAATAGICLFFFLFGGGIYDFKSPMDAKFPAEFPGWYRTAIVKTRKDLFQADCLRSLGFIAAAAALLLLYVKKVRIKPVLIGVAVSVLIFADIWTVDRRYFPSSRWTSNRSVSQPLNEEEWEKMILADKGYFRVMDTDMNSFNDSRASLRLNMLGGYHPAKLRRYQDLIDKKITKFDDNTINMLNTKYLVAKNKETGKKEVIRNETCMGPAWFVQNVYIAETPQEEMDAISEINPHRVAITSPEFKEYILRTPQDLTANIRLISHTPNILRYESHSREEKTAVFSEIYYPYGWRAFVDGKRVPIFRVNYTLRAINVPSGNHDIIFEFRPTSIYRGSKVAAAFKWVMLLGVFGTIGWSIMSAVKKRREEDEA